MNNSTTEPGFFDKFTEEQQNIILSEYLVNETKYLKAHEFPNSPGCYYYRPEFIGEEYNKTSVKNLASFLVLLIKRDVLWPILFNDETEIIPITGTPVIYFIFLNWPIGNLDDKDFYSFEYVQEEEINAYANILSN